MWGSVTRRALRPLRPLRRRLARMRPEPSGDRPFGGSQAREPSGVEPHPCGRWPGAAGMAGSAGLTGAASIRARRGEV